MAKKKTASVEVPETPMENLMAGGVGEEQSPNPAPIPVILMTRKKARGAVMEPPAELITPAVGSTVYLDPATIDMDPARNGRPINWGKVKDYAKDFSARIAAGLDPQLQEVSIYYTAEFPADAITPFMEFGFHRGLACKAYNETATQPMVLRCRVAPVPVGAQGLINNYAENHHHASLDPVAEMRYMVRLRDEHAKSGKEIAKLLGITASGVSQRLKLEKLPADVLALVTAGTIPVKGAYLLADMEDQAAQNKAVDKIVAVMDALEAGGESLAGLKLPKLKVVETAIAEAEGKSAPVVAVNPAGSVNSAGAAYGDGLTGDGGGVVIPPSITAVTETVTTADGLRAALKTPGIPQQLKKALRAVLQYQLGLIGVPVLVDRLARVLEVDPAGVLAVLGGGAGNGGGEAPPDAAE